MTNYQRYHFSFLGEGLFKFGSKDLLGEWIEFGAPCTPVPGTFTKVLVLH